jgi:hypothetical protein
MVRSKETGICRVPVRAPHRRPDYASIRDAAAWRSPAVSATPRLWRRNGKMSVKVDQRRGLRCLLGYRTVVWSVGKCGSVMKTSLHKFAARTGCALHQDASITTTDVDTITGASDVALFTKRRTYMPIALETAAALRPIEEFSVPGSTAHRRAGASGSPRHRCFVVDCIERAADRSLRSDGTPSQTTWTTARHSSSCGPVYADPGPKSTLSRRGPGPGPRSVLAASTQTE